MEYSSVPSTTSFPIRRFSPWRPASVRFGSLASVVILAALAGCANSPERAARSDEAPGVLTADNVARPVESSPDVGQPVIISPGEKTDFKPPEPEIEVGTGKFFDKRFTQGGRASAATGGKVTFNFENQPIQAAVKAILGDLLQENYAIAPNVGGNVTFSTANPIDPDQAMSVLEMLLSWTGNTLIHEDGRYTVLQIKDAIPGKLTPLTTPPSQALGYEVRIFPLEYISPSEMVKVLKPYAKPEAFINIDPGRSLLILAGTASELENYQRTIDTFDVDWLKGMSVGVFNLQHVEVGTLMPELDKVFGTTGESPLAGMFRFIPLERVNSVIAITPQVEYLDRAREWIERLDRGGSENATQLFVYNVKNIRAVDLGDYLSQIFLGSSSGGSRRSSSGSVGQGLKPVTIGGIGASGGLNKDTAPRPQSSEERAASTPSGGTAVNPDSDIRITSVEESNQLLVMATPVEWSNMQSAIRQLDIAPLQVQIEARVLEVSLTGELRYGVQWWFEGLQGVNRYENGYPYIRPNDRQRSLLGSAGPGQAGTIFWSYLNSNYEVAISALETSGLAKALAAPSLVVANNQEAQINVGQQIPVVQTFYNGLGGLGGNTGLGTTGSVQYLNTGVVMSVTPRVNPGGLVYLDVSQEVSNPGTAPEGANPPINQRQLQTQVAVQSGETILLGGLIQDSNRTTDTGVPGLSKIPILGKLFGSTRNNTDRTELIILITPRVITNTEEAREITQQYMRQFQGLKPLKAGARESTSEETQP
jgi:general secretion pathway protein D